MSAQPEVQQELPQIPEGYKTTSCVGCDTTLAYNPGDQSFACPGCQTRQTVPQALTDGESQGERQRPQPELAVPTSEPQQPEPMTPVPIDPEPEPEQEVEQEIQPSQVPPPTFYSEEEYEEPIAILSSVQASEVDPV